MNIIDAIMRPVYNILGQSENLNRQTGYDPAFESSDSPYVFSGAIGKNTSPFIVGFLPPDLFAEFAPIEVAKVVASASEPGPATSGGVTQPGTAAVPVKHVGNVGTTPGELQRSTTTFSRQDLKDAVYAELIRRGIPENRAQSITPYICAQAAVEIKYSNGQFTTFNFNIGNVHAGKSGTYIDPGGPKDPSNWKKAPVPPTGGTYALGTDTQNGVPYPVYFRASDTLAGGVSSYVGTLVGGYPGILTATNAAEYVAALRPDLRGGKKAYFTADPDVYERGMRARVAQFGGRSEPNNSSVVNSGKNANVPLTSLDVRSMAAGSTNINDNDPLGPKLGRNVRVDESRLDSVRKQNAAINNQINSMSQTPALMLLVNPSEFKKNFEHTRSVAAARRAPKIHIWAENPVRISASGRSAAQYAIRADKSGGLTNTNRIQSLSYQNLMSLFSIYKNNGKIFADDSFGEGNSGLQLLSAAVFIYFDGTIYIGSFDSFSIEDQASSVYNMGYNFQFTVRYEIDAPGVSDSDIVSLLTQSY